MKYIFVTLLACFLFEGCAQIEKVHSRTEIGKRHVATLLDGNSGIGATYAEREVVPLRLVGANRAGVIVSLGKPHPVSDRFVPKGETYEETHDTYDARWYVTYSDRHQLLKVEKASIIRDAQANKAIHSMK